jgi:prolipoprotein diacylglyceryltransferase
LIEFIKNPQEEFEVGMALNMGQLLSIPFILLGIYFVIHAFRVPKLQISYPNKFPDESKLAKKR